MKTTISATEAARSFSDILNRVRYRGETFIIERGGDAICSIAPVVKKGAKAVAPSRGKLADFLKMLREGPKPDAAFFDALVHIRENQPPVPKSKWRS